MNIQMRYLASLLTVIFVHVALGYWTLYWQPQLKSSDAIMDALMITMIPAPPTPQPEEPKPEPPKPEIKPKIVKPKIEKPKPTPIFQDELIAPAPEQIIVEREPSNSQINLEANWQGKLLGRLARFKKYPENALRRGIEGVVKLRFIVDANGKVLNVEMIESSGHNTLDSAAIGLVKRASPMPAPPVHMLKNGLAEVVVPIGFDIVRRKGKG